MVTCIILYNKCMTFSRMLMYRTSLAIDHKITFVILLPNRVAIWLDEELVALFALYS